MDRFLGNGHKLRIFCFRKPANSKQAWPKCHIINYLLTWLAQAVLENIGPQSFLYGPRCARLVRG